MHHKKRNTLYTALLGFLNRKAKEMGYSVHTKFNAKKKTFTISNINNEVNFNLL